MTRQRHETVKALLSGLAIAMISPGLTACSSAPEAVGVANSPTIVPPASVTPPTNDAATRRNPVVAGRASRVFIMAGLGPNCEALGDPQISIIEQPKKGEVSLKPGQLTSIEASASGTCLGQKAMGTGIYYTARPGETGKDAFAIEARLATGEMARRAFEIEIIE